MSISRFTRPPVLSVPYVAFLARLANETLLIVRWRKTPVELVSGALRHLAQSGARVAGLVVTRVEPRHGYGGRYGGAYGYKGALSSQQYASQNGAGATS